MARDETDKRNIERDEAKIGTQATSITRSVRVRENGVIIERNVCIIEYHDEEQTTEVL